jgi:hypothetical protein
MVPLQTQNEIRHGEKLIRCEDCGVILTPQSDEADSDVRLETNTEEVDGPLVSGIDPQEAESLEASDT